jgi:hypothetical protein
VFEEYYQRLQQVIVEVVGASFPNFVGDISSYSSLPVRWDIAIVKNKQPLERATLYYSWLPVASWEDAGAEVRFSDHGIPFGDGKDILDALVRLNRPSTYISRCSGWSAVPNFDGRQRSGHFDGATPVMREVCSLLADEINHIFSALPLHDEVN